MRKIPWNELPEWARREIKAAGKRGISQVQRNNDSLQVQNGVARFNGVLVAAKGEKVDLSDTVEETISFANLPEWAKKKIRKAGKFSMVQVSVGSDALQVSCGSVTFNGITVVDIK